MAWRNSRTSRVRRASPKWGRHRSFLTPQSDTGHRGSLPPWPDPDTSLPALVGHARPGGRSPPEPRPRRHARASSRARGSGGGRFARYQRRVDERAFGPTIARLRRAVSGGARCGGPAACGRHRATAVALPGRRTQRDVPGARCRAVDRCLVSRRRPGLDGAESLARPTVAGACWASTAPPRLAR